MKTFIRGLFSRTAPLKLLGIIAILGILGYGGYHLWRVSGELAAVKQDLAATTDGFQNKMSEITKDIADIQGKNADLSSLLNSENQKSSSLADQFTQVANKVGTLDKLSQIDPELLKKYSKIYFLNENYVPKLLANIDTAYLYDKNKQWQIHASVSPYLERLLGDAAKESTGLEIISAYRSFGSQANLKSMYKVTYGAGTANSFSADQGYSEHQLGTAVDFTTPAVADSFSGFEKTIAYAWLVDNAYKYGFILSYPPNNNYYIYEPWHWRFVGVSLATKLHDENKYFYDLDQREIDIYLVSLFD